MGCGVFDAGFFQKIARRGNFGALDSQLFPTLLCLMRRKYDTYPLEQGNYDMA